MGYRVQHAGDLLGQQRPAESHLPISSRHGEPPSRPQQWPYTLSHSAGQHLVRHRAIHHSISTGTVTHRCYGAGCCRSTVRQRASTHFDPRPWRMAPYVTIGFVTHPSPSSAFGSAVYPDVPIVDRLVVTTVVDGTYNSVVPGRHLGTAEVQRTNLPRPPSLLAEHGLAYHLTSARGDQQRQVLLDFGLTSHTLFHNLK